MPTYTQNTFQQPAWNTLTGAMLVDCTVQATVAIATLASPLPAGTSYLGSVGIDVPVGATPWTVRATSAANTAVTAAQAAAAGAKNHLLGYTVVIRGAAVGADVGISFQDGTTEIAYDGIGSGAARGARVNVASDVSIAVGSTNKALNCVVAPPVRAQSPK